MNEIDLKSIDLNLLVVLDLLLETQSVTDSARRLGRTQSAISHALGRLRGLFADPLLVRVGPRMRPTPRAEALREPLGALLERTRELVAPEPAFDPGSARLRLQLTASDYLQLVIVLPMLAVLRARAPGVDVVVGPPDPDYGHKLAHGELDLALVVNEHPPGLHSCELVEDRFVCVGSRARQRLRRLDLERYAELAHVLVSPSGRPGSVVDGALAKLGRERRVAVVLPDFISALRLVAGSTLITTVPERLVEAVADPKLRRWPTPLELPPLRLRLAWHERVAHAPAMSWIRQQFLEVAGALAPIQGPVRGSRKRPHRAGSKAAAK